MKLSILTCLLFALPIVCMDNGTHEQTKTEFSEECLYKCGPGFAFGGFVGVILGACIGIPGAIAIGSPSFLFTTMLGCAAVGTGYGSLLAITCCMKPGTPIRITKQLNNKTHPELEDVT